jgi:hypothetical protein
MSNSKPGWRPDPPNGKMVEGINSTRVIAVILIGCVFGVWAVVWLAGNIFGPLLADRAAETEISIEDSGATPPSPPPPTAAAAERGQETTASSGPELVPPPPTRGYVLLGADTYPITRAEAKLSKSGDKIAILFFGNEELTDPPVSVVVELDPRTPDCTEHEIKRYRLIVKLPYDPTTGGTYTQTIERLPAHDGFVEIVSFTCDRRRGGTLRLNLVGSWSPGGAEPAPLLNYGFAIESELR